MTAKTMAEAQKIIQRVVLMQHELFSIGLVRTSAQMGKVTEMIGWEMGDMMNAAGLVGKDEAKRQKRHAAWERRSARKVAELSL